MKIDNGALLIFRLFGINVYLHWSWAIVAAWQIYDSRGNVSIFSGHPHELPYHIALYLCLFLIVTIHEFGHALACRSVGGTAEKIFLWPFGGIAYVRPPQRPGALLWSIVAGPLVNVVLVPLTLAPALIMMANAGGDAADFMFDLAWINLILLIFNMLPIYPLDGGQTLQALLWFMTGRSLSLIIAAVIGLVGGAAVALTALYFGQIWLACIVIYMGTRAINGLRAGLALRRLEKVPRHLNAACPSCMQNPPAGPFWRCACGRAFDTFLTGAQCPGCGRSFDVTGCPFCGTSSPVDMWFSARGFPLETAPTLAKTPLLRVEPNENFPH